MKIKYAPHSRVKVLRALKAGITASGEISRFCNLPVQTARKALRDLEKRGYIKIKDDGKKKAYIMKNIKQTFLGVHILPNETRLCVYSAEGKAVSSVLRTESVCEAILSTAEKLIEGNTAGIGISIPSAASLEDGLLIPTENVGAVNIAEVTDEFRAAFSLPVFVGTDAACGGIYYINKAPTAEDGITVFVSAGESIDCAVFYEGRLLSGACGLSGLLGHMSINKAGERCYCGNRGCLEGYAGLNKLYDGGDMTLFGIKQARTFDDIKAEYQNGETETVRQIEALSTELALGIANLVNLLNPAYIAVGGDLVKIGDVMTAPLHSVIKQRVMPQSFNCLHFETITETDEAAAGAALGVFEEILKN